MTSPRGAMPCQAMLMFLRVYMIPRAILYHSELWNDSTTTFATIAQVC